MATLILGTVGRVIGGPIGGLVGTFLGGTVDRTVFGTGATRDGPRLADLSVQSSAYGQPLPRLFGRMRAAGNVIWSPGIVEAVQHTGGGKSRAASNSYSYSASFAVALSARPIAGIGRIWADGKLLRDADGTYLFPAAMRLYTGGEAQAVDPLIAAAEGLDATPAYRGLAYVVFDDLPLASFANRIPNLTFEVFADSGDTIGIDTVAIDLCAGAAVRGTGSFVAVQGWSATRAGSIKSQLDPLVGIGDLGFHDTGDRLELTTGCTVTQAIAPDDLGAAVPGSAEPQLIDHRAAASAVVDGVALGFADCGRDYQYGLQRAVRRQPATRLDQRDLPAALDAGTAKALAARILGAAAAKRTTATLRLPWRYAAISPGTIVTTGDGRSWRVRGVAMTNMVVELTAEAVPAAEVAATPADAGRAAPNLGAAPGPTVLHVLDLPTLPGPLPATPRLWAAAAGASDGWRRADLLVSSDAGESYAYGASIAAPTTMGSTLSALPYGDDSRWDRSSSFDVGLLADTMWLDSRSEAAVLGGANLALVGDEIVQFATARPLGAGRFRLGGLLRGRRGTTTVGHTVGERFVMLDAATLVPLDPGTDAIGTSWHVKAVGPLDDAAAVAPRVVPVTGRCLRPLPPAALAVHHDPDAGFTISWKRSSRAGFVWPDGADVPLAEDTERYEIVIAVDGRTTLRTVIGVPTLTYPQAQFVQDGGTPSSVLKVAVAQVSAVVGTGAPATVVTIAR